MVPYRGPALWLVPSQSWGGWDQVGRLVSLCGGCPRRGAARSLDRLGTTLLLGSASDTNSRGWAGKGGTWKQLRPLGASHRQERKAGAAWAEEEADCRLLGRREALSAPHRFAAHYKHCNLVSAPALIKGPLDTLRPLRSTD